jgi:hypothetical protein
MALGALTVVEKTQGQGPLWVVRASIVGDGAYAAGGSTGLLAKLRAALMAPGLNILGVVAQSLPATVSELEYDHATEKLFARVRTTGVESAVSDQSAVTYGLLIFAC